MAYLFSTLILVSIWTNQAEAQGQKIQVQILNKSSDGLKWMVQGAGLSSGDILSVGTSCRLRVDQVRGNRAIVLANDCPIRDKARKGQKFSAMHTRAEAGGGLVVTEADDGRAGSKSTSAPSKPSDSSGKIMDGFRVGARFGSLSGEFDTPGSGDKVEFTRSFGASLGYGSVPSSGMGFLIEGIYDIYSKGSGIRGEGLGVFAFNPRLYAMAGVVGSYLIPDVEGADGNPGYGFKGGAGFALTKSILLEASYAYMHHTWTLTGAAEGDVNMNVTGLEFGLNYAF